MAAGRTEVVLEFIGEDGRLVKTLRNVEQRASGLLGVIGKLGKVGSAASGLVGMANTVATLGSALTTAAPAALALPGILLGVGAAALTAKVGMSGFSDALGGDADAMAKLAPTARATAEAVRGFGQQWDGVRRATQGALFDKLAPQVQALGKQYLPVLREQLPEIASGLNLMARNASTAAQSPMFKGSVSAILTNTAMATHNASGALANFVSGFVKLGAVGSTYLPGIATAIDGVAIRFNAWVDRVGPNGIRAMIDGGIEGFRQLGQLISTIGSGISAVASGINAGLGAGATPLTLLNEKAQLLVTTLQSPAAQAALTQLGAAIRAVSDAFNAVLPPLLGFAFQIAGVLLPAVTGLANLIGQYPGVFAAFAAAVIGVVGAVRLLLGVTTAVRAAIAAWTAAQVAYTAVMGLFTAGSLLARGATVAWTAVQWLLNAALSANPIGLVVIAIAALVAGLILAWQNSETFRAIVMAAWEGVKAGASALVSGVQSALAWFGSLPGLAAAWFGGMVTAALAKGAELIGWARGIPGQVMGVLGNIGNLLINSGRALINGFWNGIKSVWSGLVSWFQGQLAWFRGLWPFSPAKWGPFSGRGYVTYSGKALVGDFADSLAAGMPAVAAAASDLMGAAAGPLGGVGDVVRWGDVDEGTWNRLMSEGWRGRADDGMEALYRPAGSTSSGGGVEVRFAGNTSDALATVIMQLIRTGKIQIARV